MSRYVTTMLAIFVLAFGVCAQASPQHQHSVTTIDGAKNPELIPDAVALRMWLLTVSIPQNPTVKEQETQKAHLGKLELTNQADYLQLQVILTDFRSQYFMLIDRFNESAKTALSQGGQVDQKFFLQQREYLVQATKTAINERLTPHSFTKVDGAVQSLKSTIQLHLPKE